MEFLRRGLIIIIGSIFISIGINGFFTPFKILDGGVIGLGLIVHYLFDIETGLTIICISIPVFIIAWFYYKSYFFNSLHGLLVSSLSIDLLAQHISFELDAPLNAVIGGILVGLGIGIMLRFKTSTGGTDLIAQFVSDMSGINVGLLILLIDGMVIILGGYLFSSQTFFLSALAVLFVGITTSLCTWNVKHPIAEGQ
ncbi:YitT family protein [Radiobacillus sp. PE A8.2]|uniref:YitT family protein n=1 Tax=Radiobacillus sp. PE A8.2 TaxID=3380349 RepID=UPI00388D044D